MFNRTVLTNPNGLAYLHAFKGSNNEYIEHKKSWREMGVRVAKLASSLISLCNLKKGDVVSIIAPNSSAILETHFAVPGAGGVLHTINTRLDATTIAYQLTHCEAKVVFVDSEFNSLMKEVKMKLEASGRIPLPMFINIIDVETQHKSKVDTTTLIGSIEYEDLVSKGTQTYRLLHCDDELDAITLNYTSGTTGNPKGVVTHYRGAYLNSISNQIELNIPSSSSYLWVVPMFHCNGWCFPWTLANGGSTSYLMRQVRAELLFDLIERYHISFLSGAPVTMNTMLSYPQRRRFTHTVKMMVAGAPPPPALMDRFSHELGVTVQTAYGLTETYGPISTYIPYNHNPIDVNTTTKSVPEMLQRTHQVFNTTLESMTVMDPLTMQPVPPDGLTMGEVMIRGNIVMKGYLKNERATKECFEGGWFHSGDLAVLHTDGRIELKDRSKDIIISGGENISSIEVENIMVTHPRIFEVAVIAMPDEKWGEVPCAFVTLNENEKEKTPTESEIIQWCRTKMAAFQSPKRIIFGDLPKTSTGKVQKNELRKLLC